MLLNPQFAEAQFKIGLAHHDRGELNTALDWYLKARQSNPTLVEAHYNAGLALYALNRPDEAVRCYQRCIRLRPNFAQAHNNLGQVLKDKGKWDDASTCFKQAISLKSDFPEPHYNLADICYRRGQIEEAITSYQLAIRCRPNFVEAYNNLGTVFKEQGNYDAAIQHYRIAIRLDPNLAETYYNLGSTFRILERFDDAIACFKRALALKPGYAEAHNNLGITYKNLGRFQEAIQCFSRAIECKPGLAEARWNRSFSHLLLGNFEDGWNDFEWRFQLNRAPTIYPHRFDKPRWGGKPVFDKRVLVHDEQGLGDTFQFVRYLPMLKSICAQLIFETQAPLIPLLKNFPGIDRLIVRSADSPPTEDFDLYVPLLSLPRAFQTRMQTIPNSVPYLFADPGKVEYWRRKLDPSTLKVGVVWAGRPQHPNDRNRSCRLEQFLPLAQVSGVALIGLQKGPAAAQSQQVPMTGQIENLGGQLRDFADTAALIENLDLIISVDTSVAHLAGAMGKPVWVLLPFVPDWRWMAEGEESPWYPTMRLFRQSRIGQWEAVIERIRQELQWLAHPAR